MVLVLIFFSLTELYVNSSNQSVPNLSCIINSTKEKLINDPYDSGRNKPLPPPFVPPCSGLPFIIQINTNNTSSGSTANNQFKLPMVPTGNYYFIVDWGDSQITKMKGYSNVTHTYASPGIYTITITGQFEGWSFNNTGDRLKLLDIIQWGECFRLGTSEGGYFQGASNMNISATDPINLSGTTSLSECFMDCATMNSSNVIGWDVSNVTNMSFMFRSATSFNQNIGGWNVSNVTAINGMFLSATSFNNGGSNSIQNWSAPLCTTFASMFQSATAFNQPLTNLVNTSGVSGCNMLSMFYLATSFNQNIGGWNLSKVTNMNTMFLSATSFNNGGSNSIQNWSAPICPTFASTFQTATAFNQPLTNLVNTSGVAGCIMTSTFQNATSFNQNIGGWDVSKVTSMTSMFLGATSFNNGGSNSIQTWSSPLCTNFASMFSIATTFNQPLTNLVNTSGLSDGCNMYQMFYRATSFNQNINTWDITKVTNIANMFQLTSFNNGGASGTSLIPITLSAPLCINFTAMFQQNAAFNQPITNLVNTSGVSSCTLKNMFVSATAFNQNIGSWDVSNVTNTSFMFNGATAFNQNIGGWNTSNVTDMSSMFNTASAFNQNIGGWDVSKVTAMSSMFQSSPFNNGGSNTIQNWSAPLCTSFASMFQSATSFNQPLTNLVNTSGVAECIFTNMFISAIAFNQNIGGWNVSKATLMDTMFRNATVFNNGGSNTIQNWSAPICTSFSSMFYLAAAFNQPLTNLVNTSGVAGCTMIQMFRQASIFNQNIGSWNVSKATDMTNMFLSATAFNNGGSTAIQNWSAPLCTSFSGMFQSTPFNQPLTNLVNTSGVASCSMSQMFQSASTFNQNIGSWNVSNVTNIFNMFLSATAFNNGGSNTIQNWSAPLCTTFKAMFQSATSFNQPLTNLVNTSGVASCDMSDMFRSASAFNQNIGSWNTSNVTNMSSMFIGTTSLSTTTRFNNGETGLTSIPNITPSTSSYTNATKVLNCPGATFLSTLSIGDVLIIQTSALVYSSSIQSITDNTNLVLTTAYGSNITVGTITSINKQIAGTSPLNWNTSKVTTMANMFQYCLFFNQNISTSGSNWNTNLVNNLSSMFIGTSTALITLFNNGQIITGTTAPMAWTFNVAPTSTNYRTNCYLTTSNKPASLA